MSEEKDTLTLKWGTLKAWRIVSDAARKVAEDIDKRDLSWSLGAAQQVMTDEHKKAVCDLIDAVNCETICNDWTGESMTKEEAKKYVMEYRS
jgi:hypothetical protein